MKRSPKKEKPARWEFLDELDGRPIDDSPIRTHRRKPALWEILLYICVAILWGVAIWACHPARSGTTGLLLLGISVLGLRLFLYEKMRRSRCKTSVLGTVESFTRRRLIRKNARYPVIRFEANGLAFHTHGAKPFHPSTVGNEEWVYYNPTNPDDSFVASDSKPTAALLLTVITGVLGVVFLLLDLS